MADDSDAALTYSAQLARAEQILATAGLARRREDATELLSHLLDVPVSELLAWPAAPVRQADARIYAVWVARRAAGEALARIIGHLEFMGLDITIGRDGPLTPPGAQRLVETALQWARRRAPGELLAAEVGTGCGAIALALAALEPCFTSIYAVGSSTALEAARTNGARYLLNLVINWLDGVGLDTVPESVDLIVCGQPAWADLEQAPAKLRPGGALICAVTQAQRLAVDELLARSFSVAPVWVEGRDAGDEFALVVAQLLRDQEGC